MRFKSGFTLVELAIVLVIIGLIVGGVLVGRDLIRTAELRSVLSDIEKYQAAVNTFRNKYNAIPGDFRYATGIWGAADADPSQCEAATTGGTLTCNGNGDSQISDSFEAYLFWQHLGNANLVGFTPTAGAAAPAVGDTLPFLSGMKDIATLPMGMGSVPDPGTDDAFGGNYGNALLTASATSYISFSPEDAFWLDEKKDDGKPGTGSVVSFKGDGAPATINPDCTTTAVASTAEYDLTYTATACTFILKKAF